MSNPFKDRVASAFTESETDNYEKYLDLLMSSWAKTANMVTKTVVWIFVMAGIFELLINKSTATSVSIGSISLANSSVVQYLIPPLIAYLLYDAVCLVERWWDQGDIFDGIIQKYQPKLFSSELLPFVVPQPRGPWTFDYSEAPTFMSRGRKFEYDMDVYIGLAGYTLPLVFEAQAYYLLATRYGLRNALLWISAALAIAFLSIWIIRTVYAIRSHQSGINS